ncbi:membrane protein [Marmoricola endophyticus]|uniref:Membrane protein n=1 Tax=Marmoricola endophyticus TaxID=2040280 RepID=A0A917BH72_9ACTN|nr:membrane protein [Marmoricola endophyticus]
MTEWLLLLAALVLVAGCGMFVAAEFALVTVDRGSVERAAESGDRGARGVLAALRTLSTQLSGAQVGITVTNLAIGFLAEPAIAGLIDGPLESWGVPSGVVPGLSVVIGLVVATALTMVAGELVPKNLAISAPYATARATSGFQRVFTRAMAWPIRGLNGSANAIVRRLGVEPQEELRSARTSEELLSVARRSAAEGTLDPETAALVERSVAFGPRTAGEIMTPRRRMESVDRDASVLAVVELARSSGHSRFPVVHEGADHVVGAIHVKQAVSVPVAERGAARVRDHMVEALRVPDSIRLDPLLGELRAGGFQMAVVVDEYGGTAGVVTLEDVVEEIVGEIADEHDRIDDGGGHQVVARRDGSWSVAGLLRPDELREATGVEVPASEQYDTVAGLLVASLGRVPETGDEAVVPLPAQVGEEGDPLGPPEEALLVVERMDGLRVDRLRVVRREVAGGRDE